MVAAKEKEIALMSQQKSGDMQDRMAGKITRAIVKKKVM